VADLEPAPADSDEPYAFGWYVFTLAVYVAAGFFLKTWLLNWIIGPLFLLLTLYLVPTWLRRLVRRGRAR
jgi:hypothetical protein